MHFKDKVYSYISSIQLIFPLIVSRFLQTEITVILFYSPRSTRLGEGGHVLISFY